MDYEEAFDIAVKRNAATGVRYIIYFCQWTRDYFASSHVLPMPHSWAIHIGEVGRMTKR